MGEKILKVICGYTLQETARPECWVEQIPPVPPESHQIRGAGHNSAQGIRHTLHRCGIAANLERHAVRGVVPGQQPPLVRSTPSELQIDCPLSIPEFILGASAGYPSAGRVRVGYEVETVYRLGALGASNHNAARCMHGSPAASGLHTLTHANTSSFKQSSVVPRCFLPVQALGMPSAVTQDSPAPFRMDPRDPPAGAGGD